MDVTPDTTTARPSDRELLRVLTLAASALGERFAYAHVGRYHFPLEDGWSIAIKPDSARRFRVEACRYMAPVDTLWVLADDVERLAGLIVEIAGAVDRQITTKLEG